MCSERVVLSDFHFTAPIPMSCSEGLLSRGSAVALQRSQLQPYPRSLIPKDDNRLYQSTVIQDVRCSKLAATFLETRFTTSRSALPPSEPAMNPRVRGRGRGARCTGYALSSSWSKRMGYTSCEWGRSLKWRSRKRCGSPRRCMSGT